MLTTKDPYIPALNYIIATLRTAITQGLEFHATGDR